MDLSAMLVREDFFPAFFATVKSYYQEVLRRDVTIDFAPAKECNLVIKPYLSAATAPKLSSAARDFFYSEWNIRNAPLKRAAAKAGVALLTRSGKVFSKYKFRLQPDEAITKDLVIAPNNRSIRFFDYAAGTVGCMIKDGFSDKYFKNQLQFRLDHQYDFLLPPERWGDRWFTEPILTGHPLARVTDEALYQKGISDAFTAIRTLADDTKRRVDARAYLRTLTERITALCAEAKEKKKIKTADDTLRLLDIYQSVENVFPAQITLVMSHGDLQTGNIWMEDSGKTILYDWETAGERSIWYDSAVLGCSLRRANQWRQFLRSDAENACRACAESDRAAPAVVKYAVLLEDVLMHLEDMTELPSDWGGEIYDRYLLDLKNAVTEVGIA